MMMIGIVDYGMGNLKSVFSAFEYLGADVTIIAHPEELAKADKIILPGVGAFEKCKDNLDKAGFTEALHEQVIKKAKPTLGICVGMQLMAQKGFEAGEWDGLNWFNSQVIKLHPSDTALKIPNIGWCETEIDNTFPLFKKLPQKSVFYYVHSYYMKCNNPSDVVAKYNFTHDVTAAIHKDNIAATQFHPEKSQDAGLQLLENFINWKP
jgi:imidazole glycerol-phosphate synthase subunit HisH